MELILKKLDNLANYVSYINEKNDDNLTELIAKLNVAEEKLNRMLVRVHKSEIEKKYKEDYEEAQQINKQNNELGNIRVGRILTTKDKGRKTPITFGYFNVTAILSPGKNLGRELDPNYLKYNGKIISNIWEFSKIYPQHVKTTDIEKLKHSLTNIKPEYWDWQESGFNSQTIIRYPFSMQSYGEHIGFIKKTGSVIELLTESEARKKIFAPIYKKTVIKTDDYKKLTEMLNDGYNLQICDFNALQGSLESLNITQKKGAYGEDKVGSIEINEEIIEKMLNSKHEFTTAFYLAAFLLELL